MIVLKDILISARQEAHRMRHYFLGVEHIFIALLEIKHGLAGTVLEEYGLANDYVIDAVRRKAGKGSKHRLWAGIPNTPRTEVIFDVAQEIARESSRTTINERDLLIAILEENDSIPARVLQSLDIDLLDLKQKAKTVNPVQVATGAFTKIDVSTELKGGLTNEQNFILRRMFQDYARIRVETSLTGGYTDSQLLVVTPFRVGDFSVASVVVKIGPTDAILDEAQRYNRYVKDTLPPLTARLEDKPIAPDSSDMAGLKYTFLTDSAGNPTDMRAKVKEWKGEQLGRWLHQRLYGQFGEKWWKQTRPYRFEAWREYDWLLPPILTLKLTDTDKKPKDAPVLRFPIRRSKLMDLDLGQVIAIDNFIVYKVNPDKGTIRLALSQGESNARAYQIEVQGIDFDKETFFRGEVVDRLVGTVWKTRDDELMGALHKLSPDFEVRNNSITINNAMLPNPVKFYNPLLDAIVMGSISTIHGDLHLGNILIGPSDSALLIDFGLTRDGHSIFDWANLEVSILSELVVPLIEDSWEDVRQLISYLAVIDNPELSDNIPEAINDALKAITALRGIVEQSLAEDDMWYEYSLALAFTALRAMTWETMNITSRRVMYLVSALAMYHFNRREADIGDHTPSPEETDFMTD